MLWPGLFGLVLALGAGVPVEGPGECPRAAEVASRVARLLPPSQADSPHRAELGATDDGLRVRLFGPGGVLIAERVLPSSRRCGELAEAAAVLIAAWEMELRPAAADALAPRPPAVTPVPDAAISTDPPVLRTYELGGAPRIGWLEGGAVLGMEARGAALSTSRRFGATMVVSGQLPVEQQTSRGPARWTRIEVGLGPMARLERGTLFLDSFFEGAVGVLVLGGPGAPPGRRVAFDPSVAAGLRAGARIAGDVAFWVSATVRASLDPQRLEDGENPVDVPRLGAMLALGVSKAFGR